MVSMCRDMLLTVLVEFLTLLGWGGGQSGFVVFHECFLVDCLNFVRNKPSQRNEMACLEFQAQMNCHSRWMPRGRRMIYPHFVPRTVSVSNSKQIGKRKTSFDMAQSEIYFS